MTLRFLPPVLLSASITFLLFWIMTALIAVPEIHLDPPSITITHIVEVMKAEEAPPPPPKMPVRPPTPEQPTLPNILTDPSKVTAAIPGPGPVTGGGIYNRPSLFDLGGDGDAVPIVRVAPNYPQRALVGGIEGRVLVQFTIDRSGGVKDVEVLAAEPPNIFDAAARKAVEQWRYSPRVENGVAVERQGLKIAIPFQLGRS